MGKSLPEVVLVRPKFQGNIGSVARAMGNFGLERLTLVGDVELEDDAYRYSKHARPILENVRLCGELGEALRSADLTVATSGVTNANEKKRERNPLTPRQLAERLEEYEGTVALVFGPEDDGLRKEEFTACDLVVTIPASRDYPIMNLSHSAAVIFYELRAAWRPAGVRPRSAGGEERDLLMEKFRLLLESTDYPEHKTEKTEVLFRRVLGRATLSKWEFHTLMGVFDRAVRRINNDASGRAVRRTNNDASGRAVRRTNNDASGRVVRRTNNDASGRAVRRTNNDASGRAVKRMGPDGRLEEEEEDDTQEGKGGGGV